MDVIQCTVDGPPKTGWISQRRERRPEKDSGRQNGRLASWIRTTMSHPRLPQEISDYILDLQNEHKALKQCCLVSKSWFPRARKNLFAMVRFESPLDLAAWARTFPDPANSPGYLARSLYVAPVVYFASVIARNPNWFQPFLNVVQLEIRTGMRTRSTFFVSSSQFPHRSLPDRTLTGLRDRLFPPPS